jgi:hypothetical protein
MDPYLENPAIWPDVHGRLIYGASDLLTPQVRPKYTVRSELRVYLSDENDPGRKLMIPDARITVTPLVERARKVKGRRKVSAGARTAVDEVAPVEVIELIDEEVREARLLVRNAATQDVVTIIEVLSPTNKLPGARGHEEYLEKRRQLIASGTHLVEIDLLRAGQRFGPEHDLPPHEYRVIVSRADRRPRLTIWPVRLDQRLPKVPVPLLPGDPDARLDLQSLFEGLYDRGAFGDGTDCGREPVPPLPPKWRRWADKLLREKRAR